MTDEEIKSLFAKAAAEIVNLAAEGKETDRRFKETDRRFKETEEQMKRTDLKMAELFEKMGGIDDNIGHHAEEFFQNAFEKNMVFGGVEYHDMIPNMSHNEKDGVEFDIVLVNRDSVALIEVKNRIHPKFVRTLAVDRLKKFRAYFPRYGKYKAYLGIAGFSFSKAVLEEAKKYGVGIVRQAGESIEVDAGKLTAYP